ncbi:MAG: hypothetical protein RR863_02075 [Erysipelotrichaceae bacterium]
MKKSKGILFALMIGSGNGLFFTFCVVDYPFSIKVIGIIFSLAVLICGLIGNLRLYKA